MVAYLCHFHLRVSLVRNELDLWAFGIFEPHSLNVDNGRYKNLSISDSKITWSNSQEM